MGDAASEFTRSTVASVAALAERAEGIGGSAPGLSSDLGAVFDQDVIDTAPNVADDPDAFGSDLSVQLPDGSTSKAPNADTTPAAPGPMVATPTSMSSLWPADPDNRKVERDGRTR